MMLFLLMLHVVAVIAGVAGMGVACRDKNAALFVLGLTCFAVNAIALVVIKV